jgi:hypothetical protein
VSFDIFLQAFEDGDAGRGDADAVVAALNPMIAQRGKGWVHIRTGDGSADVYGTDDPGSGLMFNHVEGRDAWDVIYDVARLAKFVVMPVGCGTLLPDDAMRRDLPDGIPEPVLLIRSGADIVRIVTGTE